MIPGAAIQNWSSMKIYKRIVHYDNVKKKKLQHTQRAFQGLVNTKHSINARVSTPMFVVGLDVSPCISV